MKSTQLNSNYGATLSRFSRESFEMGGYRVGNYLDLVLCLRGTSLLRSVFRSLPNGLPSAFVNKYVVSSVVY